MYRLAYRKFVDHEALTVNHAVAIGTNTGIRWYEVRDPGGAPKIYQQSTYSPDALTRWMGSVAMDKAGNLLLGYSTSSAKVFPSLRYAGREAADPSGLLSEEVILAAGNGSQPGVSRWGDYASVSVDPTDDCTFWLTGQYVRKSGSYNWSTAITKIKFASCK
jgi:hypothetical protein